MEVVAIVYGIMAMVFAFLIGFSIGSINIIRKYDKRVRMLAKKLEERDLEWQDF